MDFGCMVAADMREIFDDVRLDPAFGVRFGRN